jgi:DNA-binding NarL/FixJ family response regulator
LREALGIVFSPIERYVYEPYIADAQAEIEGAAWEAAWAEGRAMKPREITKHALSKEGAAALSAPTPGKGSVGKTVDELAPREREVALLVARGLTNRQIAKELVISEHTVATYISRIHKKLTLHSRTQIAALLTDQSLLLPSVPSGQS